MILKAFERVFCLQDRVSCYNRCKITAFVGTSIMSTVRHGGGVMLWGRLLLQALKTLIETWSLLSKAGKTNKSLWPPAGAHLVMQPHNEPKNTTSGWLKTEEGTILVGGEKCRVWVQVPAQSKLRRCSGCRERSQDLLQHLQDTAEVPLSKVQNPRMIRGGSRWVGDSSGVLLTCSWDGLQNPRRDPEGDKVVQKKQNRKQN